jgi:hypothetical protein
LIRLANEADIGIHPLIAVSNQTRYALPNKLFEYVMASCALCVSDTPEMSGLVAKYGLGRLIAAPTPAAIADAVNGFTPESVQNFKLRASAAAKELCWEHERSILLTAYEEIAERIERTDGR